VIQQSGALLEQGRILSCVEFRWATHRWIVDVINVLDARIRDVFVQWGVLSQDGAEEQVVVDAGADDEQDEAEGLQILEIFPPDGQGVDPNDEGADAVDDHSCRGAHFFRHTDPGEIEESNADNVSDQSNGDDVIVLNLSESIESIFESASGESTQGAPNRDVIEWNQQDREGDETKQSFPTNSLEWMNWFP